MVKKNILNGMKDKTRKEIVSLLNIQKANARSLILFNKKSSSEYRDLKVQISIFVNYLKNI